MIINYTRHFLPDIVEFIYKISLLKENNYLIDRRYHYLIATVIPLQGGF